MRQKYLRKFCQFWAAQFCASALRLHSWGPTKFFKQVPGYLRIIVCLFVQGYILFREWCTWYTLAWPIKLVFAEVQMGPALPPQSKDVLQSGWLSPFQWRICTGIIFLLSFTPGHRSFTSRPSAGAKFNFPCARQAARVLFIKGKYGEE